MAKCPECRSELNVPKDVVENEIVDCEFCGAELEITGIDPIKVELAPEEQEDWGE